MSQDNTIEQQIGRIHFGNIYAKIGESIDKEMKFDFAEAIRTRSVISDRIGDIRWSIWSVLQLTGLHHEPV